MAEQIVLFEPSGPELFELAEKHERTAAKLRRLYETLNVSGWTASSGPVLRALMESERRAIECYMLAEFEALGGVA